MLCLNQVLGGKHGIHTAVGGLLAARAVALPGKTLAFLVDDYYQFSVNEYVYLLPRMTLRRPCVRRDKLKLIFRYFAIQGAFCIHFQ